MTWSDLSTEDYNLHPGLKKHIRGIKIGLALIAAAILFAVAAVLYFLYLYNSGDKLAWVPALVTIPMVLPLGFLYYYLSHTYVPKVLRVSQVVRYVTPMTLTAKSLAFADFSGTYVELRRPEAGETGPPLGIAAVNAGKGKVLPPKAAPVSVYFEKGSADRYLVIEHGKNIFWGHMTTAESRERGLKQFRKLTIGLVAMFMVLIAGLIVTQLIKLRETRRTLALSESSENWPRTPGVITSSRLVEARIPRGKGTVPGFRAAIEYTYAVDGREFQGRLIHLWYRPTREKQASAKLIEAFPDGSQVQVAFNPDDPGLAVLETGHLEEGRRELRKNTTAAVGITAASLLCLIIIGGLLIYTGRRGAKALRQYSDLA